MNWLHNFPQMDGTTLLGLKNTIDNSFKELIAAYGDQLDRLIAPLQSALLSLDKLLTGTSWLIVTGVILLVAWGASRSWKTVLSCLVVLLLVGYFGMWDDTMRTISMTLVATVISIIVGIPIGILMSRSMLAMRILYPILDMMQTIPSFVYLIPVVMLLGIGRVPGLIAIIIYAIPPVIRLTNLGIRLVDKEICEAADSFGASDFQKLFKVQLPLALPTIMAGINQTIMMALAMVVIAAMIGVQGLGQPVLKAIANQYLALGVFNGLAIVGIAIIFDRVSQAYGRRLQKHEEGQRG